MDPSKLSNDKLMGKLGREGSKQLADVVEAQFREGHARKLQSKNQLGAWRTFAIPVLVLYSLHPGILPDPGPFPLTYGPLFPAWVLIWKTHWVYREPDHWSNEPFLPEWLYVATGWMILLLLVGIALLT